MTEALSLCISEQLLEMKCYVKLDMASAFFIGKNYEQAKCLQKEGIGSFVLLLIIADLLVTFDKS